MWVAGTFPEDKMISVLPDAPWVEGTFPENKKNFILGVFLIARYASRVPD